MTEAEKANLANLKEEHRLSMEKYDGNVRDYIAKYSNDNCDYLLHNRMMSNYHRGAWNALNSVDRF